jgi:hypothetical protein
MNQILQALMALDGRLSKLESGATSTGGKPHIQSTSSTVNLHEGDPFTINGQNLFAAGMNTVQVALGAAVTQVTQFIFQTDSQLIFNIPPMGAQVGGSQVTVQVVSPTQGSDSVSFLLLPAAVTIPTGDIRIQIAAPPNTTFNAGTGGNPATYTLNYTLNANTTLGDTYDLLPTVTGNGWTITPDVPSVFIDKAPSLSQPTIKTGTLKLSIPSGATGSGTLKFEVRSRLNPSGLDKTSLPAVIPVGGTVPLSAGIGIVAKPGPNDVDGSGNLLVPAGSVGLTLNFLVTVTNAPKDYLLAYRFDNDPGNWQTPTPPNSTKVTISQANVGAPVSVVIRTNANAQPSNLYFKVTQSDDQNTVTEVFYPVRVK